VDSPFSQDLHNSSQTILGTELRAERPLSPRWHYLKYDHAFNTAAVPFGFAHSCFIFVLVLLKKLSRPRPTSRDLAMGADNWRSRNVVQHTAQLAAGDIICLLLPIRRIAIRLKYSISYAFDHLNPRPFKCTTPTHFASPPSQSCGKKLFLEAFVLDSPSWQICAFAPGDLPACPAGLSFRNPLRSRSMRISNKSPDRSHAAPLPTACLALRSPLGRCRRHAGLVSR
jgi:hypothetical protein